MRTRRTLVRIALVAAMLTLITPAPAGAVMTSIDGAVLTDDVFTQTRPSIWNGLTAWQDNRNGSWDIYGYAASELPLATGPLPQLDPVVSRDCVAYSVLTAAGEDIWAYMRSSGTNVPICTAAGSQRNPAAYERYIAWEDDRNGNLDIYAYDLQTGTEFPVCTAAGAQSSVAVWGDTFVWLDARVNAAYDIWYWDASVGGSPMPLVMNANAKVEPDICQEWVVWTERVSGSYDIRAYNRSTEQERTIYTGPGSQLNPSIDGDWLVFSNLLAGNPDFELFDMIPGVYYDLWPDNDVSSNPDMQAGAIVNEQVMGGDTEIAIGGPAWTHDVQQIWGSDRYQTAAAIAIASFPQGSRSVLIATGENFPDALGAAALAGHENIPILLTDGDALSPSCANGLEELGVNDNVWIVGGEGVISPAVVDQVMALLPAGSEPAKRISGADRYGTALAIADTLSGGSGNLDEPYGFVATGLNYPDALAASSIAYALDIPIYLVPGTTVPQATLDQMVADGVTKPVILGGEGAVGAAVESALESRFGQVNVTRVWGPNRYQTAYEVSQWAADVLDFGMSGACVATGESFPDALAGGQLAGTRYAPIVLTSGTSLSLAAQDFCTGNEREVRYITFLGGTGAISQPVRDTMNGFLH